MTRDLDPHRCASGPGCVNPEIRGDTDPETGKEIRRGAVIADGPLCAGCRTRLAYAVKGMASDWLRLSVALGERQGEDGDKVTTTRNPGIPLNTSVEALMARLVEVADRAAEMVASELGLSTQLPSDYRRRDLAVVDRAAKRLADTIDVLRAAPAQPAMVWSPIPRGDDEWDPELGQPRELVELSGLDVAEEIVQVNRAVGRLLGKSRTQRRRHYQMPCSCGGVGSLGRDYGVDFINCTACGMTYTEDEYDFLSGLTLTEIKTREERDMLLWLLAEAYWRLDRLRDAVDAMDDYSLLDEPGAAQVFVEHITQKVLDAGEVPHSQPAERQTAAPDDAKKEARR